MVEFRQLLVACESEILAGTLEPDKRLELQQGALGIAHGCRALIAKGWRLVLPEPKLKARASRKEEANYQHRTMSF
jgi:hypothetical protein